MHETDDTRMQYLPLRRIRLLCASVHGISEQRMVDRGHVNADLVRAPRLEAAGYMRKTMLQRFDHMIVRHRSPAVWLNAHLLSVRRVARDGRVHGAVLADIAFDDTFVYAFDGMNAQLPGNGRMGGIILTHDQQSGGVPVNPVYNPGASDTVDT